MITFKNTNYGSGSDAFLIDAVEMENNSTTYTVAVNGNYLCKFVPNKKGVYTFLQQILSSSIYSHESMEILKAIEH